MQKQAQKDLKAGSLDENSVNAYFQQHMQKVGSVTGAAQGLFRSWCQELKLAGIYILSQSSLREILLICKSSSYHVCKDPYLALTDVRLCGRCSRASGLSM